MVDTFSYFPFQSELHGWYYNDRGMCYPTSGMMHIEELLLLIVKNSPCSDRCGFPLSLSGPLVDHMFDAIQPLI